MTQQQFEDTLRQFIRREPFVPFVVERLDGTLVEVSERHVVFNAGAATYITPDFTLIEFACEEVRAIRPTTQEATS